MVDGVEKKNGTPSGAEELQFENIEINPINYTTFCHARCARNPGN